jgi:hypothetical protein
MDLLGKGWVEFNFDEASKYNLKVVKIGGILKTYFENRSLNMIWFGKVGFLTRFG